MATDIRLWLRAECQQLESLVRQLVKDLVDRAQREIHVLMPGYTHLQVG